MDRQPLLETISALIKNLSLSLSVQYKHLLELGRTFFKTWQQSTRPVSPLFAGQHRKCDCPVSHRQRHGRIVTLAYSGHVLRLEAYPFHFRDIAAVLLSHLLRAISIALQDLYTVRVPVHQAKRFYGWFDMIEKGAQETPSREVWVPFCLFSELVEEQQNLEKTLP